MNLLSRLRDGTAGSTSIEFSIVCLVFVLGVFGVLECGRAINIRTQLSQAADNGARKVLTDKLITDSALETAIRSAFSAGAVGLLTVSIALETVDGVPCRTITLSYPFSPSLAALGSLALTLTVVRRTPVI